ncbi:MAG: hypothetical protein B6D39_04960 [Anaerolineae bacterium UTCFX2]|jgi:hypothetical protein|nr:MAG: hypothetical protein B6D39_04960 [Anaerolineae bacterium UTCFX2]
MPIRRAVFFILSGLALILFSISVFFVTSASAKPAVQEVPTETPPPAAETPVAPPEGATPNLSLADDYCLGCHGAPGETLTLPSSEEWDLYTPAEMHQASIHGQMGYACVQCHTEVGEYPHPPFQANDLRDVTLQLNNVCGRCHTSQFELEQDSVHSAARAAGIREAAVCVDCHTAHEVRQLTDPNTHKLLPETRQWIPERCGLCHSEIYQKYAQSVHGTALSEGNPDVPTCIDCHGVHNIEDPRTAYFRLRSPQMCAKCHTDAKLMAKYGLSTTVLNTYVDDFHGTTAVLFEKLSPDAQVNTPVCYDCHGVHDINSVNDPETGLQMRANLLKRCQICHPDANTNFPAAWMSHYEPSPEVYPLVYYVNLFYKYFIPVTLGGMALLVVLDVSRGMLNRRRERVIQAAEKPGEIQPDLDVEGDEDMELSASAEDPANAGKTVESAGAQIAEKEEVHPEASEVETEASQLVDDHATALAEDVTHKDKDKDQGVETATDEAEDNHG